MVWSCVIPTSVAKSQYLYILVHIQNMLRINIWIHWGRWIPTHLSHRLSTHIIRYKKLVLTTSPAIPLLIACPHPKVKHIIDHCRWLHFSSFVATIHENYPVSEERSIKKNGFDGMNMLVGGTGRLTLTWENSSNFTMKVDNFLDFSHVCLATLRFGEAHGILIILGWQVWFYHGLSLDPH